MKKFELEKVGMNHFEETLTTIIELTKTHKQLK